MPERPRPSFNIQPIEDPRNTELQRRAELRRGSLVPVYFMHTSDVPKREARAALAGVIDAMRAAGQERQLHNFGAARFSEGTGAYSSPDWYVQEAYRRQPLRRVADHGPQIDVEQVDRLFRDEPYQQNPHWEVMVTGYDLNARAGENGEYINFVYGMTNTDFPSSVQSVRRHLDELPEGNLRDAVIRRLLRHETGHMFKLPIRQENTEEMLGAHCTNICTMRQGMSMDEWVYLTVDEIKNEVHFCEDCTHDLAASKDKYKPLNPKGQDLFTAAGPEPEVGKQTGEISDEENGNTTLRRWPGKSK